jgi:hypothetical protein
LFQKGIVFSHDGILKELPGISQAGVYDHSFWLRFCFFFAQVSEKRCFAIAFSFF